MKFSALTFLILTLAGCAGQPDREPEPTWSGPPFAGQTWHLVEIQSMDDRRYRPSIESGLSVTFHADGSMSVVADCRRASGNYEYTAPSSIVPGPLASTKAVCQPLSLGERFLRELSHVRSFVLEQGRLYLATRADGAILEFVSADTSLDCAQAQGEVENLVCSDAELAAHDRRLDAVFAEILQGMPAGVQSQVRASQRGWIKGRNECWQARDMRACVEREYRLRLSELQIGTGRFTAPTPVVYDCSDASVISAYFYGETEIPAAVVNRAADQAFVYLVPSASGARYEGGDISLWLKGNQAAVNWGGTAPTLKCIVKQR